MTCQVLYHKVKTPIIFLNAWGSKTFNLCFTASKLLMGKVEKKINTLLNLALFFLLIWDFDNF